MANFLINLIEALVEQELDEINSIGAGGVSATGGSPLGQDMKPVHKKMWSEELAENVLDKMGLEKATSNVRKGALSGEVYMDRHDHDKAHTKKVMSTVSKNLNKEPYSKDPPRMGLKAD